MKLGYKGWLLILAILTVCGIGIYHSTYMKCHVDILPIRLIVWYCIIVISVILYVVSIEGSEFMVRPADLFFVIELCFLLIDVFVSIWTIAGTIWVAFDITSAYSCLNGLDFWITFFFLGIVYMAIFIMFSVFIYKSYSKSKSQAAVIALKNDLNRIYNDEEFFCKIDIDRFIKKNKKLLDAEPIMDGESSILMKYCSKQVDGGVQEDECGVFLVTFEPRDLKTRTDCKHVFHYDCVIGWYKLKASCPYCRKSFREGLLKAYHARLTRNHQMEINNDF